MIFISLSTAVVFFFFQYTVLQLYDDRMSTHAHIEKDFLLFQLEILHRRINTSGFKLVTENLFHLCMKLRDVQANHSYPSTIFIVIVIWNPARIGEVVSTLSGVFAFQADQNPHLGTYICNVILSFSQRVQTHFTLQCIPWVLTMHLLLNNFSILMFVLNTCDCKYLQHLKSKTCRSLLVHEHFLNPSFVMYFLAHPYEFPNHWLHICNRAHHFTGCLPVI